jgi:hypothetical protein
LFEDEDTEDETEDEDVPVALTVTDEIAHIDIEDMDKDPLKEIESNVKGETLVLNL